MVEHAVNRIPHVNKVEGLDGRLTDTRPLLGRPTKNFVLGQFRRPTLNHPPQRRNNILNASQRRRRRQRRQQQRSDKRYDRLKPYISFQQTFGFDAIYQATIKCRRGVMWKNTTLNFDNRRAVNCWKLTQELADGAYRKSRPIRFDISERGKLRHISAVTFRDRVVQRALCDNSLVPIVRSQLIYDNAASLPGRGTSFARKRFEQHYRQAVRKWKHPYVVVFDCSNYFGSISSQRAFNMISSLYRSIARTEQEKQDVERILNVLKIFVLDEPHLGLGNQTSQTMAIWYLNKIDHWCSSQGLYGRYMDDAYCFCENRSQAEQVKAGYERRVNQLGLQLNQRKTRIVDCLTGQIAFLKRVYSLQEDGSLLIRMHHKALQAGRRHSRNLIHAYDGVHVSLRTIQDSWTSHESTLTGLSNRRGLCAREKEWYRSHCLTRGLRFGL